jgi:hypothetical protein
MGFSHMMSNTYYQLRLGGYNNCTSISLESKEAEGPKGFLSLNSIVRCANNCI